MSLRPPVAPGWLTLRGILLLVLGAVTTGAGLVFGLVDLTRAGVLLLALPLAARIVGGPSPRRLEVHRWVEPAELEAGQEGRVHLTVRNTARLRSAPALIEDHVSHALGDRPRLVLRPLGAGDEHRVTYPVRSRRRGVHTVGPLRLRQADALGLTRRTATHAGSAEVVVLPAVHPLGASASGPGDIGVQTHSALRVAQQGADDLTVRPYVRGDALHRVHWRSTARRGEVMVRQEDRPEQPRALVLLDTRSSCWPPGAAQAFEWAVEMTASVVVHLEAQGLETLLLTSGGAGGAGAAVPPPAAGAARVALAAVSPTEDAAAEVPARTAAATARPGDLAILITGGGAAPSAPVLAAAGSASRRLAVVLPTAGDPARVAESLARGGWTARLVSVDDSPATVWQGLTAGDTSAHPAPAAVAVR